MLCPSAKANQNFFFRFPLEKKTRTSCWLFSYQNDGHQRKRAGSRIKPSSRRSCFASVSPCSDRVPRALHRWPGPTATFVGDKPSKTTHGEDTNPAGVPAALGLGGYLEQGGGMGGHVWWWHMVLVRSFHGHMLLCVINHGWARW